MPRFLTIKKIAILCMLAISILLLFTKVWIISILILLAVLLYVLNKIVRESTNKMPLLSARREIKKYQYLIIGDVCPHSILKNYISQPGNSLILLSPNRSLDASYQILLHTISILDENGTCIIIDSGKQIKKPYTIFDIPYLSLIARKELKIEFLEKERFYPLFYEPIKSLLILLNFSLRRRYKNEICKDKRFEDFFQHRATQFIYLHA